jgi:predicted metal-dependent peptidase
MAIDKEQIKETWKEIKKGLKVKTKLTEKMDEKLELVVKESQSPNWKKKFEEAIIQMLTFGSSKEQLLWYGHLVTQCQIIKDLNLPAPAGVRFMFNKYELHLNPLLFNLYSIEEQIAILKHEMLHIINLHVIRRKNRNPEKWNYATDISINQLITNIPEDGLQPETFKLKKNLNAENYYDLIPDKYLNNQQQQGQGQGQGQQQQQGQGQGSGEGQDQQGEGQQQGQGQGSSEGQQQGQGQGSGEGQQQSQGQGSGEGQGQGSGVIDSEEKLKDLISQALQSAENGMIGDHSLWDKSQGNESAAKEITRQMTETATNKSRGMTPSEAMDAITMLNKKEQIDWKKEFRKIVGNKRANSRLTIKRRDRRFPNRKDLRGKTRDHTIDVLVILDVSGSMSNEELQYGLNEIKAIAEKAKAGVTIIQVDTEPYLVKDFDPKKSKSFNRMGNGGTYLYPAIELAEEEKINYNAVAVITDGWIEDDWEKIPKKVPYIWLVTENESNLTFNIDKYSFMKKYPLKINEEGK